MNPRAAGTGRTVGTIAAFFTDTNIQSPLLSQMSTTAMNVKAHVGVAAAAGALMFALVPLLAEAPARRPKVEAPPMVSASSAFSA
jgi:hypothetical protein